MVLPDIICLQSVYSKKYLRYRYENVQTHGLLQFAGDNVMDPYAQFQVEKAKCGDGLVHLKCRYNNKYLVRWSPNHYWITATAYQPDENKHSWTCTLFKPIVVESCGNTQKIRLLHVQLDHHACLWRAGAPFDSCLFAGYKEHDRDSCDVFKAIDWESIFKFPRRAALKGDNGLYLGADSCNGQNTLKFSYRDARDPKVAQEIFSSHDGTLYIKSSCYGKFWRVGDGNRIVADANDPRGTNNASAMFKVSVVDKNIIALTNMNPTLFCAREASNDSKGSFICANANSIDKCSKLEVVNLEC